MKITTRIRHNMRASFFTAISRNTRPALTESERRFFTWVEHAPILTENEWCALLCRRFGVIAILSGLAAGAVHVISGPDHLAAIAPLAISNWRKALAIGFRWGLGHSSGVLFVGVLALLARELIPVEALSGWAERFVGVLLIAIGVWGLRRSLKTHLHAHEHTHDGTTHVHYHAHAPREAHVPTEKRVHQHTHTAFLVGTVHGLAGGSHFLGVVPALLFPTRIQSLLYLAAFAVGTVVGMISFASAIGMAGRKLEAHPARLRWLTSGASTAAILLGCYWIVG